MQGSGNIIRILVDGYSLTHHWLELEPGKPRHSEQVRNRLIQILRKFQSAYQTPITLVFDAAFVNQKRRRSEGEMNTDDFEILFTQSGQTADEVIERVTHRLVEYGNVVAVTNDRAEQDTVRAMGGYAVRCEEFVTQIKKVLSEQESFIRDHNKKERRAFQHKKKSNGLRK